MDMGQNQSKPTTPSVHPPAPPPVTSFPEESWSDDVADDTCYTEMDQSIDVVDDTGAGEGLAMTLQNNGDSSHFLTSTHDNRDGNLTGTCPAEKNQSIHDDSGKGDEPVFPEYLEDTDPEINQPTDDDSVIGVTMNRDEELANIQQQTEEPQPQPDLLGSHKPTNWFWHWPKTTAATNHSGKTVNPDIAVAASSQPSVSEQEPLSNPTPPIKCFFCPELTTRGRKVKRTKIHLQHQPQAQLLNNGVDGSDVASNAISSQLHSKESEATQGFHQLCNLLTIETGQGQLTQNLDIDYLLACNQCTNKLIALNNYIGVHCKVVEKIQRSVAGICDGILKTGANANGLLHQNPENPESNSKLNSFRKAFGIYEDDKSSPDESDSSEDDEKSISHLAPAPIDWKHLTKDILKSKNLYNPVNFAPLRLRLPSQIEVEREPEVKTSGHGGHMVALENEKNEEEDLAFPIDRDDHDLNEEITHPKLAASLPLQNQLKPEDEEQQLVQTIQIQEEPIIPIITPREIRHKNRRRKIRKPFSKSLAKNMPKFVPFKFTNDQDILERIQTGVENLECKTCKKAFISMLHLIVHSRSHTGDITNPSQSQDCEQESQGIVNQMNTINGESQNAHVVPNRVPDPPNQHMCTKCPDLGSMNSVQFRSHQRISHPEEVRASYISIPGDRKEDLPEANQDLVISVPNSAKSSSSEIVFPENADMHLDTNHNAEPKRRALRQKEKNDGWLYSINHDWSDDEGKERPEDHTLTSDDELYHPNRKRSIKSNSSTPKRKKLKQTKSDKPSNGNSTSPASTHSSPGSSSTSITSCSYPKTKKQLKDKKSISSPGHSEGNVASIIFGKEADNPVAITTSHPQPNDLKLKRDKPNGNAFADPKDSSPATSSSPIASGPSKKQIHGKKNYGCISNPGNGESNGASITITPRNKVNSSTSGSANTSHQQPNNLQLKPRNRANFSGNAIPDSTDHELAPASRANCLGSPKNNLHRKPSRSPDITSIPLHVHGQGDSNSKKGTTKTRVTPTLTPFPNPKPKLPISRPRIWKRMTTSVPESSNINKCEYGDHMTAYKGYLERNENDVHLNIRPFLCEHCGEAFTHGLEEHQASYQSSCS